MKVDISDKIAIIRRYKLSPEELSILLNLNPDQETLSELAQGNHSILIEWINNSINNSSINDEHRLYFAHFANIIEKHIEDNMDSIVDCQRENISNIVDCQRENISNIVDEYEQDMTTYYNYELQTDEDKKKYNEFKKHKKDIQSWSQNEITTKLINFVETDFPYIFEIGIKGKKQEVRNAFYSFINLYDYFWELTSKTRDCLCKAQDFIVNESEKRRIEYERRMVTKWTDEFKNWCDDLGLTKYTKTNIKEFFKELGINVLPTTIDLLKSKL